MQDRGEIISRMMKKQRDIVIDVTGNANIQFRAIFYDELSDLLAQGYIHPPAGTSFIWIYVATRRDHYPNEDIQRLTDSSDLRLGYQFTSTGSHLAAVEGPWKMEKNYRYLAAKNNKPIAFSVVNAGNIREYVMKLSANAVMMRDFKSFQSDSFLKDFCAQYYGSKNAAAAANLYRDYYNSYWCQKRSDLAGLDCQYIFQDLRYKKTILDICSNFEKENYPNPLKDMAGEQQKGRTFGIVPADNNAANEIDAIINGTTQSAKQFLKVAKEEDALSNTIGKMRSHFSMIICIHPLITCITLTNVCCKYLKHIN